MAVTQNNYTGNGSTVLFSFTFPYLEQTDVQVRLDGVLQPTTAYSFANATTVQLNTAPANGVNIIIFRNTDNDNKKATFYPGSAIKAEDLNNNIDQILYVAQEVDNNAMSSLGDTPMQGDFPLGQGLGIIFEGSSTDDNETRLGVIDPTADRNINLPDVSGTVITTGDTGTVTSTMIADGTIVSGDIADGTIVNADINASAAIAGTKINPSFGTQDLSLTGNISVSGTVDGRDISTDGSKLDGIESGATADQTAAEIRTLVESATDSNVFTDADHTKLNNIETAATADQTASEIKSLYESNSDTNVFTNAEKTFLSDVTATATEINYTTNVTSDIQSQIDGKQPLDSELTTLSGMQAGTASQLASSTALTATTTNLNITQGMTKATTLTTNSDTEFPTSKAVNDRILTVTNALGGFVAIADKDNFPTSHPDPSGNAGTVVSISNAQGISVNSSGVGTLATRAGGSDAVIINGFPSALRGGATVGSATNANPYVLPANVGLQVQTTGTAHTYDYHKYLINEEDANKLSGEIQDFQERYRVAASAPTSNNDDGDLYFDTTANKMKVYNASSSSWDDVATPGNFLLNTISSSSGSGGGSATFKGTATRFTLSNPPDQYAQQLLVSINGVIQKPNSGTSPSEGFAIDGNDIIFAAAPPSGSNYFIVTQGSSVNIGTPSDNTISTAKIQSGAITNDKVSASAAIAKSKLAALDIVNADVNASAAIAKSKLAALDIVNADVNASAAIAGTKIAPDFGSQDPTTTGKFITNSSSSGDYIRLYAGSGTGKWDIYGNGANLRIGDNDSAGAVTIDTNVGIGTTSPSRKLHVVTSENNDAASIINSDTTNSYGLNVQGGGSASGRYILRLAEAGGNEKLRVDSSGNLGIGTTDPTSALHISDSNTSGGIRLIDSSTSAGAPNLEIISKRSDSNNNTAFASNIFLGKNRTDAKISSAITLGSINFGGNHTDGTEGNISYAASIRGVARSSFNSKTDMPTDLIFCTGTSGADRTGESAGNSNAGTERLRINSSGYIFVGRTTEPGQGDNGAFMSGNSYHVFARNTSSATSAVFRVFGANGEFRVTGNGNAKNTNNNYDAISDQVLKENIVDANSQWDDIKALKIRNYNFKESTGYSTHKQIGVIAQELEASGMNGLVATDDDELYTENDTLPEGKNIGDVKEKGGTKSVHYSVLYMKAVKALQEAMAKIETLETKVAALEAK